MTKLTKNEKLLREATSKWSKFLKEGAFKGQANEDALYFGDDAKDDDGNPILATGPVQPPPLFPVRAHARAGPDRGGV